MNKFLCIHGHFYQPPRENPWSGAIEDQESAAPHHNWNARITSECYTPNANTQILNNQNQAIQTVNNYSQISFNFGPTLLSWMEEAYPETYQSILDADKGSIERFSGHGAAIAQAYNHMIMPLSNDHDKQTQVIWGIQDFKHRFKRQPEGMWLPETAVNIKTLEILADNAIKFTILSPTQAQQVKRIDSNEWIDVSEGAIDTQLPYVCRLPSGKKIVLFFYNGHIANEAAFGTLLKNGVQFADRLMEEYPEHQQKPRLVHIANDGETYGHHHSFGNMALAYMLYYIQTNNLAEITIYGQFLGYSPPQHEVEIIEDTSWSCFHGIDRWKTHCGCRLNMVVNWNQEWREHLRKSLDWLRDYLAAHYEQEMSNYYGDPWQIRNNYISVILDRSKENQKNILWKSSNKELSDAQRLKINELLEMQRYALLMYTSCGWFFDDISGLEAVQILQYAARAMQLMTNVSGNDLEDEFLNRLAAAKSNLPEMGDGRKIYNLYVKSAMAGSRFK